MIFTILCIGGTITLCLAFAKATRSLLAKAFWIILMIILLALFLFP